MTRRGARAKACAAAVLEVEAYACYEENETASSDVFISLGNHIVAREGRIKCAFVQQSYAVKAA